MTVELVRNTLDALGILYQEYPDPSEIIYDYRTDEYDFVIVAYRGCSIHFVFKGNVLVDLWSVE